MRQSIVFDITKLAADRLPGPLGMDGMSRAIHHWADQLAKSPGVAFFSAVPPDILKSRVAGDPLFSYLKWDADPFPFQQPCPAWCRRVLEMMPPHQAKGLPASLRRSAAYRMVSRLHRTGVDSFDRSGSEPVLFHMPQTRLLEGNLPGNWKPVMNVYDLAPFIFRDTYNERTRQYMSKSINRIKELKGDLVVNSQDIRHALVCSFDLDPRKVHVVPLGAARSGGGGNQGDAPFAGKKYFIAINSGWQRRKNLKVTIQAFLDFRAQTGSDCELWLTGAGSDKVAQEWGVKPEDRESFPVKGFGHVDEAKLDQLISHAVCGLYLSLYEGFGLPPLEYMNRGIPVICSSNGAVAEVAGPGGLMVDAFSGAAISAAMARMVESVELRQEFAAAGMRTAQRMTW